MAEKEGSEDSLKSQYDGKGSAEKLPAAKGAPMDKSADVGKKNESQYKDIAKSYEYA